MATYKEAKKQKKKHKEFLLGFPNVVGIGIGKKREKDDGVFEYHLRVYVNKKVVKDLLKDDELIPESIDGIKIEIVEIGDVKAHDK